ncbi:Integrase core domain protein [compost metagenome]
MLVGEIYAGDGHTVDCYVAHPNTGKVYRPELTVWIDIKSRYITGWYLTESESAVSTMFALSHAMQKHNHVPAWAYVDRGPGYRAHMLSDESTGFYARFDIGVIGALPGNPHGKGWIERFFRTVRDKHDKFFAGGQFYCGDDMAPEVNRRLSTECNTGKRELPSLQQYVDSFTRWLEHYHNKPMDVLGGRTPAQVWAELTPVAVELDMASVARPREECTVGRQQIRLHNRFYFAEALALYDANKVDVEYDLHNDARVWVFDKKGRFVCTALLVNTKGVLPASRLEEGRDRRLQGQEKRLLRKLDEARARRNDPLTAGDQLAALESLGGPMLLPPPPPPPPGNNVIDIDITSWRKDA